MKTSSEVLVFASSPAGVLFWVGAKSIVLMSCVVVLLFSFVHSAHAATALVLYDEVITTEIDEYGDLVEYINEVIVGSIADGDTYITNLNEEHLVYISSDAPSFGLEGYLYFINNEGLREFVAHLGGPFGDGSIAWDTTGSYELDVYEVEPPVLIQGSWWGVFLEKIIRTPVAYAQSPEFFVETIHFTIAEESTVAPCCSSVVFLPGIKGSILKKRDILGVVDTLWPPTIWSNDVAQLTLTDSGESVNNVFVDGILNNFTVGPFSEPVYSDFSSFMDATVASGTIAAWGSFPYDWRLLPETILENGIKTADGTVDLIEQIEELAADSDTGQVTIIAHSMGGLMGKAIIKKLEAEGKENLIDSFVMVGSPQLGTPQAITSLLHGDGEGIPNNVSGFFSVVNNSVAEPSAVRTLAQNMRSSYNLLPSLAYFDAVNSSVFEFDEQASYTEDWRTLWGNAINTYSEYVSFLTGTGVERVQPDEDELQIPEILSADTVSDVADFHAMYDSYTFPSHIRVVEVAGWGRPTVKGVRYTTEHDTQDYHPLFTREGDSTVVYVSAISSADVEEYFFNIFDYNEGLNTDISHKDLLSTLSVQQAVTSVIEEQAIENITFISTTKPDVSDSEDQLLVSAHSPVVLGVYDTQGNFTGVDVINGALVENIPGSSLSIFGQSQYIFLPKEGTYNFTYKGTGDGPATINIETFIDDVATVVTSYSDIPTTPNTVASFEVEASELEDTEIDIDQNGDGITDVTVSPDESEPSLEECISRLKLLIANLPVDKKVKKKLLKKVKAFEKRSTHRSKKFKNYRRHLDTKLLNFETKFLHKRGKISKKDASEVLKLLGKIKEKI